MTTKETFEARIDALAPGIDIYKPAGTGPFPVVIQLHGCGGKKPPQARWATAARESGWAAVVIDSHKHRHISTLEAYSMVCTGLRLWGKERAGDLFAAIAWARRQPWADPDRIVAAGWSHGAWTILDGLALKPGDDAEEATGLTELPKEPLTGLVGAFLVYPFAGPGSLARTRGLRLDVNPLALVGTHDVIVGGRSLAKTLSNILTPGPAIEIEILERATHAFDEPGSRDFRTRYDAEITAYAEGLYRKYLQAVVERTATKVRQKA
ncbi:MAG: prolyl oligopeptidase family serine peptidase [Hyphomonadaceae bacterium]